MGREGREGREEKGRGSAGYGPSQRGTYHRRKTCRFCDDENLAIDYKDFRAMRSFVTERGKILPRRMSGACAKHQREIAKAIKRARLLALLPFTATSFEGGG